jgi:hypothetical protein
MGTGFNSSIWVSAINRTGIAESMIRYACDKGIPFFDCVASYGTHPFVTAVFKSILRENYPLSSKIWI